MKKKLHHYVAAGITRNFCHEENRIFYYDVFSKTIVPSSPGDAFRIKGLHTFIDSEGLYDHNTIEDFFMKYEDSGCRVIRKLLQGKILNDDDRENLAVLWGIHLVRAPSLRTENEKFIKSLLEASLEQVDMPGVLPAMPEILTKYGATVSEMLANGAITIELKPQATMIGFSALNEITNCLRSMHWSLINSKEDNYFLLSDNPCAILDPDLEKHQNGIGLAYKNVEVTFPIGMNHCLLGSWNRIPSHFKASAYHVDIINRRTSLFGQRFFAYPYKSKKILNMLSQDANNYPIETVTKTAINEPDHRGTMVLHSYNFRKDSMGQKRYNKLPLVFPNASI